MSKGPGLARHEGDYGCLHGLTIAEGEDRCISKEPIRDVPSLQAQGETEALFTHLRLWPNKGNKKVLSPWKSEGALWGAAGPQRAQEPCHASGDKEPEVQQEARPVALAPQQTRSPPPVSTSEGLGI